MGIAETFTIPGNFVLVIVLLIFISTIEALGEAAMRRILGIDPWKGVGFWQKVFYRLPNIAGDAVLGVAIYLLLIAG